MIDHKFIEETFGIKYVDTVKIRGGFKNHPHQSDKIVYICRNSKEILKVGISCSWRRRLSNKIG